MASTKLAEETLYSSIIDAVAGICGDDNVLTGEEDRVFYGQDVYERGAPPALIARPGSVEEIVSIVRAARAENMPVYVRGGGMSYTRAYLADKDGAILLDITRLNRIREVNIADGYVTVDAGVTWKQLETRLEAQGVRPVFWGPFSGGTATIGGSMSQGSATFGSGQVGTSASTALGFEIVTAEGEILRTGMDGQPNHEPFFRPYGPDLTGLFTADAGALGIKTAVTLALEKRPNAVGGVSFSFTSFEAVHAALADAAATGLASELIAMDATVAGIQAGQANLTEDLKKLWAIVSSAHNPLRGAARGFKAAIAGRRVYNNAAFTAHFIAEGVSEKMLDAKLDALRRCGDAYGNEIPNAAIGVIRSNPFPDLPVTHFDGRRMLPISGIFPYSKVPAFEADYRAYVDSMKEQMTAAKVTLVDVFAGIGRNGMLYEPVWYWEDSLEAFHEKMSPPGIIDSMPRYEENPEGRALVEQMRVAVIDLMFRHGAAHLQIGRSYPYLRARNGPAVDLLRTIKQRVDADGVINPDALGL